MKIHLKEKEIPYLILVLFGIIMFFMGIMNHYYFRSFVFDYGNYNFAFWDYSQFRISSIPTYPGNFLQDHFSLTLMYFVPVYWLLNWLTGTYTLILIQNSLILIAAEYTYKLIKLKTDNIWLRAGVLIYYFTLLGRYTTFACDVNLAVMSACFIPVFIYYFEVKKYLISFIILILSILSRENISIWFIFIYVVLIIQHRKEKEAVIFSVADMVISLVYFILLFKVIIPSVESAEKQYTLFNYSALGANPGEALSFIIKNPVETLKLFFINHIDKPAYNGVKVEFYFVYLISGGFILFLKPRYLIWFIPIVAQKVLNDAPIRWGITTYYSIEVVTLLPLSVFLVLSSLKSVKLQKYLTIAVCVATISMTIYKLDKRNRKVPDSFIPSKENIFYKGFYQSLFHLKRTHKLLKLIPPDARLSASEHLFPHLSQRQHIYIFPTVNDAEYIVFSVFDDFFRISHMENERERNKYLSDPGWELIAEEYPVFLLRKREPVSTKIQSINRFNFKTDTLYCNFEQIDADTIQALFDNGKVADYADKLTTDNSRSGNNSLLLNHNNRYGKAIQFDDIDRIKYMQINVWFKGDEEDAHIVAQCGSRFYLQSKWVEETDDSGWKKLVLSFWIPDKIDKTNFVVYLWNSSRERPLYFDDLQIIKHLTK